MCRYVYNLFAVDYVNAVIFLITYLFVEFLDC